MTICVTTTIQGDIAMVTIDNPPVNALSHAVRLGLTVALERVETDPAIAAVIIACAGTSFSVGADVTELGGPPLPPAMSDVFRQLDALSKLTIAAIHGRALGGGLETALCCDYRCAVSSAVMGMPEIKLGLLPGGGGTQRLPRLIGVEAAIDLMVGGAPITAVKAMGLRLIDEVIEGDLLAGAVAYARALIDGGEVPRRLSRAACAAPDGFSFDDKRASALKATKGLSAAVAIVDAVQAATRLSFDDGLAEEARLFGLARASTESRALRHLFAAERQTAVLPGIARDTPTRPLRTSAVIGAGTMGVGVAAALLESGLDVTVIEQSAEGLERGRGALAGLLDAMVKRGKLTAEAREDRLSRVTFGLDMADLADADLVIECAFEDMAVKQDIFARLGAVVKPDAILATNTSALDVDAIARASGRPADVLGLHFFSPAHIMKLIEIVNGDSTAPDVLATAFALARQMGKIGVYSGVCDGFIGNRMLGGYRREAEMLVLEGARPQQVDKALTDFGMAMGMHAMLDMAGLDISAAARRRRRAEGRLPADPRYHAIADRLVELGRFGAKTGQGVYRYEAGSRTPLPDPEFAVIVASEAARLGVVQRAIDDTEVIDRCLLPIVNEGALVLAEGIALSAADIDVVYTSGYGFPRTRGGPMFWADTLGLDVVLERIEALRRAHGDLYWTPAPLLVELAETGRSFADLGRNSST